MLPVLIVEDNRALACLLERALKEAGYPVRSASTLCEGLKKARGCGVVLLDILLPDGNALSHLSSFRSLAAGEVLLMSSLTAEEEVAAGLERGGDDYIRKPFSLRELVARVGASVRRGGGLLRELTRLEGRLLQVLMSEEGRPVARERLLREVWEWQGASTDSRSVDAAVVRLRKKLGVRPDGGAYIETVRGKGYRFVGGR